MKQYLLLVAIGMANMCAMAQEAEEQKPEGFQFTTVVENPITSIKNQNRSSTCWSFSALGFLESELLRMGKGEYDLSEMYVVHHTMTDRAVNYVRYHGDASFSPGGSFADIIYCMKHYGLVPQEAMPGIMYGDSLPVHNELDAVAEAYVKAIGKGQWGKLTPVWRKGLERIYDTYLGECPRNVYLPRQGIHPAVVRPEPWHQSGQLCVTHILYPSPLLYPILHRDTRQLAQCLVVQLAH